MTKKSVGADSIREIPTGSKNKLIIWEKEFIYIYIYETGSLCFTAKVDPIP